jgi:hypothetical protein
MNINDYLIDQRNKNWPQLLSDWAGTIPESFTLWLVNRFGDAFLVVDDGSVHMLDAGVGQIARIADSRDHFAELLDRGDNANNWLMIPLVDKCVAALPQLQESQCYGFKMPPMLGGTYTLDNIEPTDLSVHYSILADIHRQTKNIPDGTKIEVVVTE